MCEHSVIGSIDPQINGMPAASIVRTVEAKPIAEVDDQTLILADVGRKAIKQLENVAAQLLSEHLQRERADELAKLLTGGTWTHDYPILPEEAQKLGLPISTEMPAEVLELMTLYPQPMQTHQTVEYLPQRRELPLAGANKPR